MKCPVCRQSLPDGAIACATCLGNNSRKEMLRQQESYIEPLAAGTMELRLARNRAGALPHIQLIGHPGYSFCGESLLAPQRRTRIFYIEKIRGSICPACMAVFDQTWQQVARIAG